MSFDLVNTAGYCFHWNNCTWLNAVKLGVLYGWQPKGTELLLDKNADEEIIEEWCRGYCSNDGQRVLASDAFAWANSLEHALDDIPDKATCNIWITFEVKGIKMEAPDNTLALPDYFSGETKKSLKKFIVFLQQGSFFIW